MGERTEHLEQRIEARRNRVNEDIDELERKAKEAVDWRVQMDRRPGAMLGLAFGAGFLLSALLSRPTRSAPRRFSADRESADFAVSNGEQSPSEDWSYEEHPLTRVLDNVKGALVGMAITKSQEFLEELLPGITDQYRKAETRRGYSKEPGVTIH